MASMRKKLSRSTSRTWADCFLRSLVTSYEFISCYWISYDITLISSSAILQVTKAPREAEKMQDTFIRNVEGDGKG